MSEARPAASHRSIAVAWGAAAGPLCLQFLRLDWFGPRVALWVAVATVVVLAALRRSVRVGAAVIVVNAVLVVGVTSFFDPFIVAGLMTVNALIAATAVGILPIHRPRRGEPRRGAPSIVLATPLIAADIVLASSSGLSTPAIIAGSGFWLVVVAALVPGAWAHVERVTAPLTAVVRRLLGGADPLLERVFRRLGQAIAVPVMTLLFAVAVVGPWLVAKVTRTDPLWAPHRTGSRWITRSSASDDLGAAALWFDDPGPRGPVMWRRRRGLAVSAVVLVGLVLGALNLRQELADDPVDEFASTTPADPSTGGGDLTDTRVAGERLAAEPWYDAWEKAYNTTLTGGRFSQFAGIELADVASPDLTVQDEVRRSWRPPATAECPAPLEVWMFGGSTMFGVGQRDDHTIASELARVAWEDGVALDVVNRGVPSDVSWVEQRRLERALATSEAPDLVVFYDGFNDIRATEWAYMAGADVDDTFLSPSDRDLLPLLNRFVEEDRDGRRVYVADPIDINARPPDERPIRDAMVFQYTESNRLSVDLLAARRIPMVRFFQPMLATLPGDDTDNAYLNRTRDRLREIRSRLPAGVIDVADVLDEVDAQLFVDDVHTTEAANPVIAARLWSELAPTIAPLTEGAAPCS